MCPLQPQFVYECVLSGPSFQPEERGATYKEKVCTRSTCDGGIFTFEKTTAHFLRTGREVALELSSNTPGITSECAELCREKGADCPAFSLDYNGQRCASLDRNTQVLQQSSKSGFVNTECCYLGAWRRVSRA